MSGAGQVDGGKWTLPPDPVQNNVRFLCSFCMQIPYLEDCRNRGHPRTYHNHMPRLSGVKRAFVVVLAAALAGGTFVLLRASDKDSGEEIFGLEYINGDRADADKHKLNLFLPKGKTNPPLVMWIHGGAWAAGDRWEETKLAKRFVDQGIAVATINHRLSPAVWMDSSLTEGVTHPAHVEDCAAAFAWLYEKAEIYGFDRASIFVSGYSSGAHLAALLALDPQYLGDHDLQLSAIRAAIPIAGAYDLEKYYEDHLLSNGRPMADSHVLGAFGSAGALYDASPSSHLLTSEVPMLVMSETETYDYTLLFERLVLMNGVKGIEFRHVRKLDRAGLYKSLAHEASSDPRSRIIDYIRRLSLHDSAPAS